MRVTSVDILASNSDNLINLSYRDPSNQNTYNVKSIIGLDADEITSKFYGASGLSNEKYYDLSLQTRDIVIQIGLNPDFRLGKSYSILRDDLYKLISSSRTGSIQLRFNDGVTTVAAISGFITKFDSPQFTKNPEVQLTIKCSDPMLKALEPIDVDVAGLAPALTTITDDKSTSPHGFQFNVLFTGSIVKFSIQDAVSPNWVFEVNLSGSPLIQFVAGDILYFSSEYNNRYVYLGRGADIIHLVDRIILDSIWPILFPGDNIFICSGNVSWDSITYYPTYWGV